jgi:Protein of unknown function (DUF3800)
VESLIIYFDESGNWGDLNKKGSSGYFLGTMLVCNSNNVVDRIKIAVRRTKKNKFNLNKKNNLELKGAFTRLPVKKYFFKCFPLEGWSLYSIILDKGIKFDYLQSASRKEELYNQLFWKLLQQIELPKTLKTVQLVLDKCKNREEIKRFDASTRNRLISILPKTARLYISHEASHNNPGLQAVDMFCWGISRKFTKHDFEWYDIFKHRIEFEEIFHIEKKTAPLISIS